MDSTKALNGDDFRAPSSLAFDSENRPYYFNDTYKEQFGKIYYLDDDGVEQVIDFKSELTSYLASNVDGGTHSAVDFEPVDTLYHANGMLSITPNNELFAAIYPRNPKPQNQDNYRFPVLVYSNNFQDTASSFEFHHFFDIDNRNDADLFIESNRGHNDITSWLPIIGLWERTGDKLHGSLNYSHLNTLTIYLPSYDNGLDLTSTLILSDSALHRSTHSGSRSWAATHDDITYIAYADIQPGDYHPTDLTKGKTSIVLAAIDRTTNSIISGSNSFFDTAHKPDEKIDKYPDGHCIPEIAVDGMGRLHIIIGSHSGSMKYYLSNHGSDKLTIDDFTLQHEVGEINDLAQNGLSYPSLIVNYENESLVTSRRRWGDNGLVRTKSHNFTNEHFLMVQCGDLTSSCYLNEIDYYTNWNHRLFIDNMGRVYSANALRSRYSSECAAEDPCEMHYAWALIYSDDGGVKWHVANKHRMANNIDGNQTYLVPAADTFVRNGLPDENYDGENNLLIKNNTPGSTTIREAYLKFDLSNLDFVSSALLTMTTESINSDGDITNFEVYRVTNDVWDETKLTWNNKPAYQTEILDSKLGDSSQVVFDLTDAINEEINANKVLSIAIVGKEEGNQRRIGFYSTTNQNGKSVIPKLTFTENSLNVLADSYVRSGTHSSNNFGTESKIAVKRYDNSSTERESYLKFDISHIDSVEKAFLILTPSLVNEDAPTTNYQVFGVTDNSWTETGITWDNKPNASGTYIDKILGSFGKMEWDITSLVNQEALQSHDTLSLVLKGEENGSKRNISFHSRETMNSDLIPRITFIGYSGQSSAREIPIVSNAGHYNEQKIEIYPNPTSDKVMIRSLGKISYYSLIDLNGRILQEGTFEVKDQSVKEIEISSLSKGLYVLRITFDTGDELIEKFLIE
ncbi:MAG: DNRLRE domain-containing protein [Ekhidna sp.]|uniref:CBM96 family carbohydrate-binding protein n=1 Tax=Ekhidna sp. TaxID=2608089 RepID=UPI0032EBB3D1